MKTIKLNIPTGIAQLVENYENWNGDIWKPEDKISKAMKDTASYRAFLRKNEDSKLELGVNHYLTITSIDKHPLSGHYEAYDISEIRDIDEVNRRGEELFVHFMRLNRAVKMCNHTFIVKLHKDSYQHWNFFIRKYG
tara:strand:- start:758 stop:1168 length:411 start_codon:yes stop_codon:yes gene_type:complete